MSGKADTSDSRLHVCVETFACADEHGTPIVVERGTNWKGEIVRLHSNYFLPVDEADEPTLSARARANLAAAIDA